MNCRYLKKEYLREKGKGNERENDKDMTTIERNSEFTLFMIIVRTDKTQGW